MIQFPARFYREGKWWMVEVPALDSLTQGESLEDARMMAEDLVRLMYEDAIEKGREVVFPGRLPGDPGWEWVRLPMRAEVALKIRSERLRAGLTMRQAAEALEVSLGTYQRWEDTKRCNATVTTLDRLATIFGKKLEVSFV